MALMTFMPAMQRCGPAVPLPEGFAGCYNGFGEHMSRLSSVSRHGIAMHMLYMECMGLLLRSLWRRAQFYVRCHMKGG